MAKDSRLVYSTETGRIRTGPAGKEATVAGDGVVRVRREKKGRGGKTVTTISGIHASAAELTSLCKQLKRLCGVGGAVKDFVIEIQGDHRERVVTFLEQRGHAVLRAGG